MLFTYRECESDRRGGGVSVSDPELGFSNKKKDNRDLKCEQSKIRTEKNEMRET